MNYLIQKIELPSQPRTGIVEEREMFAKLMERERLAQRKARRERILSLLVWWRRSRSDIQPNTRRDAGQAASRPSTRTVRPNLAPGIAAHSRARSL